jgi:hypothetical protein
MSTALIAEIRTADRRTICISHHRYGRAAFVQVHGGGAKVTIPLRNVPELVQALQRALEE